MKKLRIICGFCTQIVYLPTKRRPRSSMEDDTQSPYLILLLSLVNFPSVSAIHTCFKDHRCLFPRETKKPHIETVVQTGRGLNPRGHSTINHGNKGEDRVAKDDHLVVRLMAKLQHLLHLPHGIANKGLHILRRERHGQQSICDVAHIQVITSRRQSPPLLGHQAP